MTASIEAQVISVAGLVTPARRVDSEILVGKDVLELLTGAMYVDPLCIFREYMQNACDSIDEARLAGLYAAGDSGRIDIHLDQNARSIRIRDSGVGIPREDFVRRLTAIGGSKKRGQQLRGFRGVGRLSGLGYCQELIFRTRAPGDERVSEIAWNGRTLKELLRNANYDGQLADVVRAVAEVNTRSTADEPRSFFEVELRRVARLKNDVLLNEQEVGTYLSQIGPVPFHPEFTLGHQLSESLRAHGIDDTFRIFLNGAKTHLYRPHRDTFPIGANAQDNFSAIRPLNFTDLDGQLGAVGWVLDHSYLGAIPRRAAIGGLRLRAGNIQVGGTDLLAGLFPEARFNAWCVGEVHVLSSKLLPNGRRDDFEPSAHYQHLQGQLAPIARDLAKVCRDRSDLRNRLKRANSIVQSARSAIDLLAVGNIPPYVARFVKARLDRTLNDVDQLLSEHSLSDHEERQIRTQCTLLRRDFENLRPKQKRRIAVRGIASARRAAHEDVLQLIYEMSSSPVEAHKLASRIVERLRSTAE
jgi:hypothetical protein